MKQKRDGADDSGCNSLTAMDVFFMTQRKKAIGTTEEEDRVLGILKKREREERERERQVEGGDGGRGQHALRCASRSLFSLFHFYSTFVRGRARSCVCLFKDVTSRSMLCWSQTRVKYFEVDLKPRKITCGAPPVSPLHRFCRLSRSMSTGQRSRENG